MVDFARHALEGTFASMDACVNLVVTFSYKILVTDAALVGLSSMFEMVECAMT